MISGKPRSHDFTVGICGNFTCSNFTKNQSQKMRIGIRGKKGEDDACKYLEEKGYSVIHRNWNTRQGEIDIIAYKKDILVFIEVKARKNIIKGKPYEYVDYKKGLKLKKTIENYINAYNLQKKKHRFDIISIEYNFGKANVSHFKNIDLSYDLI